MIVFYFFNPNFEMSILKILLIFFNILADMRDLFLRLLKNIDLVLINM
jgi:hypothetical protein